MRWASVVALIRRAVEIGDDQIGLHAGRRSGRHRVAVVVRQDEAVVVDRCGLRAVCAEADVDVEQLGDRGSVSRRRRRQDADGQGRIRRRDEGGAVTEPLSSLWAFGSPAVFGPINSSSVSVDNVTSCSKRPSPVCAWLTSTVGVSSLTLTVSEPEAWSPSPSVTVKPTVTERFSSVVLWIGSTSGSFTCERVGTVAADIEREDVLCDVSPVAVRIVCPADSCVGRVVNGFLTGEAARQLVNRLKTGRRREGDRLRAVGAAVEQRVGPRPKLY